MPANEPPFNARHVYVSTYCQHTLHDQCRMTCKVCAAPCRCSCHGPFVTKTGKVLTDEAIQALADEAERGYDVSHLTSTLP